MNQYQAIQWKIEFLNPALLFINMLQMEFLLPLPLLCFSLGNFHLLFKKIHKLVSILSQIISICYLFNVKYLKYSWKKPLVTSLSDITMNYYSL